MQSLVRSTRRSWLVLLAVLTASSCIKANSSDANGGAGGSANGQAGRGGSGGAAGQGGQSGSGGQGGTGGSRSATETGTATQTTVDAGRADAGGKDAAPDTKDADTTPKDSAPPVDVAVDQAPLDTAPQPPANFPFPQNRKSANCVFPTNYRNSDVRAAYEQWKADTITKEGAGGHLRVKRTPSDTNLEQGSTVSEGIAYGMLLAVYMNDQTTFDELWKYSQLWLGGCKLMDWYIDAAGTKRLGEGAASDADEDMAFALVMADRQWGGKGTLDQSYLQTAKDQITKIWNCEVYDGKLIKPGDKWGDWNTINISYFAPAYYRVFAKIDGNQAGWDAVIKTVYDTMANALNATNGNQDNGLVPAWCTSKGEPNGKVFDNAPTNYQYDSCRTPFRIGLDWCWFGEERAKAYVAKTSTFFSKIGARNVADGYDLNGNPRPEHGGQLSAAFLGPAAVGAMSSSGYQTFIDEAYTQVAGLKLMAGGAYYEDSWTVLSLLALTGNFVDFTAQ